MEWVSLGGGIAFTAARLSGRAVLRRCCATLARPLRRAGVPRARRGVRSPASAELVTTVLDVVHNEVDIAIVDASVEAHMLDHLIYGTSPRRRSSPAAGRSPHGHRRAHVPGRRRVRRVRPGGRRSASATRSASPTPPATRWSRRRGSTGCAMPSIVVRRLDGSVEVVREFGYDDFKRSLGETTRR